MHELIATEPGVAVSHHGVKHGRESRCGARNARDKTPSWHARCREPRVRKWIACALVVALIVWFEPWTFGRRDPRTQPLRCTDALYTIAGVVGRVVTVPDQDGDARADFVVLVAEPGVSELDARQSLVLVSSLHGRTLRTLVQVGPRALDTEDSRELRGVTRRGGWDAGGDVDGDGTFDVAYGSPEDGVVHVVSGIDGRTLRSYKAAEAGDRFGASVVLADDLDGDGSCDLVVGAPGEFDVPRGGAVYAFSGRSGSTIWRHDDASSPWTGTWLRRLGDIDDDGIEDIAAAASSREQVRASVLSGADGHELRTLPGVGGPISRAGDFDGDGVRDVLAEEATRVAVLSGRTWTPLFTVKALDGIDDPFMHAASLGDLDGDGVEDLAVTSPNFHLRGYGDGAWWPFVIDLRTASLARVLAQDTRPRSAGSWESGCALVHSGRDRRVIGGVFGAPGSYDGMGQHVGALSDVDGDGAPDFVVVDVDGLHAFAGPGKK